MDNWLTRAISAADMTDEAAAKVLRMTPPEFAECKRYPGCLTINDLAALCRAMPKSGRDAVRLRLIKMLTH